MKSLAIFLIVVVALALLAAVPQVSNPSTGPIKITTLAFTNLLCSNAAPTVSSGFGTSPTIPANNGTCEFTLNVGTGGVATTGVIGLPTAATGWDCTCVDITTQNATVSACKQTAPTATTTATVGNFTDLGVAGAWAASDILTVRCQAF